MHHNFRNHNLRRERRETGSAGWGPVQSKQFPCGYFTLLRGGINPIWKLSENSWNMFCLVVLLSHQINHTVSMGNFEIFNFTDHQKHFYKFSIFSTQFHWRAFFFSNLKSESRDQMNVGKVQSVQINSVVFMLGVLGAHELFQINSHFCPVFCPLPLIFLPSNFAFSFALFHICPIFCPHFLPSPLPSTKKRARARAKNEDKI